MSEAVEAWLARHARAPDEIELGLARVRAVKERMRLRLDCPIIAVGGTNGKGSVCAFLAAMLRAAGIVAGCYTSPHIASFGERIAVDGAAAADAEVLDALAAVADAARAAGAELTYFELTTLAAAALFARAKCDVAILEVGLGGRLDAVNVFDADVAAIVSIGIDHAEYLGDTRDLIAIQKAGICRRGRPLLIGDAAPPPALEQTARAAGAQPLFFGREFGAQAAGRVWHWRGRRHALANLPMPAMRGAHQMQNAALAIAALECLPPELWPGAGAVRRGLHAAQAPGRGQVLPGAPAVVLDVAHNPAAAAALERLLFEMGYFERTVAALGMLGRKDVEGFVEALARRIDAWHVFCPEGGDMDGAELARRVTRALGAAGAARVRAHADIGAALSAAREDCGKNGRIVITGSFLTVADYWKWQKNHQQ